MPEQALEIVTDPINEEGVYEYDASIASIAKDLQSRELDKTMLVAYPFTLEARSVLEAARMEAQHVSLVEPKHLLLALTFRGEGPVGKVFKDLGIDYFKARTVVENRSGQAVKATSVVLIHSTLYRACLLLAADEAEQRNGTGTPIRSEHLLLGLLRGENGKIADLLKDLGTSVKEVYTKLLATMGEGTSQS